MTVSQVNIIEHFCSRSLVRLFFALITAGLMSCALIAQDIETQEDNQSSDEQIIADPAKPVVVEEAKKPIGSQKRFFNLNKGPSLKRQTGPVGAAPKSIMPHPFVAKGSVVVPPAPIVEKASLDNGLQLDGLSQEALGPDTNRSSLEDLNNQLLDDETRLMPAEVQEDDISNLARSFQQTDIEIAALDEIDPSGVAIITTVEGAMPRDFWAGKSRNEIIENFDYFGNAGGSAIAAELAMKMALSGFNLPTPLNPEEVTSFINARLNLLDRRGNHIGFSAMLSSLPADRDWTALDRASARNALVSGNRSKLCRLAGNHQGTDSQEVYWLRLMIFCHAAKGERATADFTLSMLDELGPVESSFYQLIDHLLVESESGATLVNVPTINDALPVQPLEAALITMIRARVQQLNLDRIDPIAVPMILASPTVATSAKAKLVAKILKEDWISSDTLDGFIRSYQPTDNERASAVELHDVEDNFVIDVVLAHMMAEDVPVDERLSYMEKAWARALAGGYAVQVAPVYSKLIADIIPHLDLATGAGTIVRMSLMAGDYDQASNWLTMLRQMPSGTNALRDAMLVNLYPLAVVSGIDGISQPSAMLFDAWWALNKDNEGIYTNAAVLAGVLEARGYTVPNKFWTLLENGPVMLDSNAASPALWRKLQIADLSGDRAGVLSVSVRLLSGASPAKVPATLAGSIIATLVKHGHREVARRMAAEMLITRGM